MCESLSTVKILMKVLFIYLFILVWFHQINMVHTDDDKPNSQILVFPTDTLITFNSLVHRIDWKIPSHPESHLELLLVASINLANQGKIIIYLFFYIK